MFKSHRFIIILSLAIFSSCYMAAQPLIGEIRMFAGNFAPRGWALCEGQELLIDNYQALYAILGLQYGGTDSTFRLPDLRGRGPIHPGPGIDVGDTGGSTSFSLNINQLPSHNHSGYIQLSDRTGNQYFSREYFLADSSLVEYERYTAKLTAHRNKRILGVQTFNTGGNQPISKRSPYQAINYIIAIQGTFPSRN